MLKKEKKFPVVYHSLELKIRFMYTLLCMIITFCSSYIYSEQLCIILAAPLLDNNTDINFIYTNLTEAFFSYLKISAFGGILFSLPFMILQIWMFIVPGLYPHEKRKITIILAIFFILIILGVVIAYVLIIPVAWKFFLSFETQSKGLLSINLQPKMDQYFSLILNILVTLSFSFQLPMCLYFILKLNILSYKWVILKRNISLVMMFILAAVISPPDILSQVFVVIPLWFLYEFVLFLILLSKEYNSLEKK